MDYNMWKQILKMCSIFGFWRIHMQGRVLTLDFYHLQFFALTSQIMAVNTVLSTPALYSGSPGFESQFGDQLAWQRYYVVPLNLPMQMVGWYLGTGHNCFFPHSFQFIRPTIQH